MYETQETEERSVTIIDSNPVEQVQRTGRAVGMYTLGLGSVAFLGLLAYLVYLVHEWLIYLGYMVLVGAGVVIAALVITPVVLLLRFLLRADFYNITQYGVTFRDFFGRHTTIAPQAVASGVKLAPQKSAKKEKPALSMLSMLDMIEQGFISPGQINVVLGYNKKGELVAKKRPNTYAIAGKGRSGKSRRATLMVGQDLIGLAPQMNIKERQYGARVFIMDPHGLGKKDSLRKLLEPLSPWIEFASTEEEVLHCTRSFTNEMEARLSGSSLLGTGDGDYVPWVIYYDEWSRFMNKYSEEATEAMITCVQSCSQEYAGVQGFAVLIGQDWTEASCGGTAIRRALQEAFIHNISTEYAQFLLPKNARKWANMTESLPARDCIHKDHEGKIEELSTPYVQDEVPTRLAEIMQELCPVELAPERPKELPESTARPIASHDTRGLTYNASTGQIEPLPFLQGFPGYSNPSSSYPSLIAQNSELAEAPYYEAMNTMNPLPVSDEGHESVMNTTQVQGETFIAEMNSEKPVPTNVTYTREQETAILNAALQLAKESNGRITRSDIMERLDWTRARYPIIKAVCDKHNIAKQ